MAALSALPSVLSLKTTLIAIGLNLTHGKSSSEFMEWTDPVSLWLSVPEWQGEEALHCGARLGTSTNAAS